MSPFPGFSWPFPGRSPEWSGTGNNNGINIGALVGEGKKVAVWTTESASLPLHENHVYVVLEVFDDGGTQRAKLYNPWGEVDTVSLAELWQNIKAIYVQ